MSEVNAGRFPLYIFSCILFSNASSLCKCEQNGQIHSLVICVKVTWFSTQKSWYQSRHVTHLEAILSPMSHEQMAQISFFLQPST
uniref:Uncharacterized protein n=1 Tax=Arundo donax TaxID=35708 RepID=A0A0A9G9C5_ARUDO